MNQLNVIMLGPTLLQQGGMATVENLILEHIPPDIEIQHISTHEDGPTLRKIAVFWQALGKLLLTLLRRETHLVHSHFSERGSVFRNAIAIAICRAFRQPVILHAHGSEFKPFYAQLPKAARQLLGLIFRQCSRIIVLSESWKDFYTATLNFTSQQVAVLPNAIEFPSELPNRKGSDKATLVFLGRMGQRKGTFDLIEAFAVLSAEVKAKAELILAGDGEVEKVRQLVETLDLESHTTVFDWVDSQQRNALLQQADAFVLPSYNEGLPMAVLEAMSWGLPVITTPVGGIPEVVKHNRNGLLINPGDISQLSGAIQSLIENETLRLLLGTTARKDVAPFDIDRYCGSLASLYRSVLDGSETNNQSS